MQQRIRSIAGLAVGAVRKGLEKLSEPARAQQLTAAARQVIESSALAGKKILITGSTRGIGRALAEGFAAEGASVAIHGRRQSDARDAASAIASSRPRKIIGVWADLAAPGAGRDLAAQAISGLGGLDLVINNAGIHDPTRKPIWATSTDELMRLLQVNLVAAFDVAVAAIPTMLERGQGGRIINISTGVASPTHIVDTGIASYGISKIALEGFSQYLAAESKELTITTLRPATLATDMVVPLFSVDQRWRLMPPESIVPAALYLATAPRDAVHGRVFDQKSLTQQLAEKAGVAGQSAE